MIVVILAFRSFCTECADLRKAVDSPVGPVR